MGFFMRASRRFFRPKNTRPFQRVPGDRRGRSPTATCTAGPATRSRPAAPSRCARRPGTRAAAACRRSAGRLPRTAPHGDVAAVELLAKLLRAGAPSRASARRRPAPGSGTPAGSPGSGCCSGGGGVSKSACHCSFSSAVGMRLRGRDPRQHSVLFFMPFSVWGRRHDRFGRAASRRNCLHGRQIVDWTSGHEGGRGRAPGSRRSRRGVRR